MKIKDYLAPGVPAMLMLGFSAGLPLLLVFSTLSAWMSDVKIDRAQIGALALISTMYGWKFVWAPLLDRYNVPGLSTLIGHRRSWMLLSQIGVATGLIGMAFANPGPGNLLPIVAFAMLVAFCSASQDIALDAFRIESVAPEFQPHAAATYTLGYRLAMLLAGAGPLLIADKLDWRIAYLTMAACMIIGPLALATVREVSSTRVPIAQSVPEWFESTVAAPFRNFFKRHGDLALVLLIFACTYRLADSLLGTMANPFYLGLGFTKTQIGEISKVYGFFMTIFGAFSAVWVVEKLGLLRALWAAGLLAALSNLAFIALAHQGAQMSWLIVAISADNFGSGLAGAVTIVFLTSFTDRKYSATQYALFSSLPQLVGKFLAGGSGVVVNELGYQGFFFYTILAGLPGLLILAFYGRRFVAHLAKVD
jgi:MFS transporter, PAT family, beta-lactamase induction signal transducer AmpG